jgi:sulfate adenylyltransferase subunit 1 (EFTu-like GTPase family)
MSLKANSILKTALWLKDVSSYSQTHLTRIFRQYIIILRCVLVLLDSSLLPYRHLDPNMIVSNKFSMEWPKGSGILQEFPEVDRAGWFTLEEARRKMHPAQAEFLDRLVRLIGGGERTGGGQTGLEDHQPS